MDTVESQTHFLEDINASITGNNKLTRDDVSEFTYKQLGAIEEYLKKLRNEQLLTNPSGYSFILKKYKKLVFYRSNQYINNLEDNFPDSKFSPYINLYLRTKNEYKKFDDITFITALKKGLLSDTFKKEIEKKRRYSSEYKRSVRDYINGLFDYRSRLLVIRIDLSYRKGGLVTAQNQRGFFKNITTKNKSDMNKPFVKHVQKLKFLKDFSLEVREHREMLLKQLKKQYPKGFVGYIWKLEYTEMKSFHYHMMFFLDGSEHREDITIAQNIGELWVNQITQGDGLYWNCNANKDKYRNLGIGMINHNDKALRKNVLETAFYLVKRDYLIRSVMFNSKNRAFGKGHNPAKSKSGRPRKESIKGFEIEKNTN